MTVKSFSYSTSPFHCVHHYLILREYFILFPPSDVMNASQPCQIQVTTFILTVVPRNRQKKNHIYLQRLCWSYQGERRKNWNVCCPVLRHQNHGQILLHCNKGCLLLSRCGLGGSLRHICMSDMSLSSCSSSWTLEKQPLSFWTYLETGQSILEPRLCCKTAVLQNFPGWIIHSSSNKHSGFLLCPVDWSVS